MHQRAILIILSNFMEALQPRAEGQPAKRPPPPDFSKKSFAQMFKNEQQQLQPLEFPLSVHKGEVAIRIPAAAIDKLAAPFKYALVGKFSHGRPTLEEIRKALSKLDFKGALDVGLIDYRHVLLRFHSEADYHRIWTTGIWQIGKYPMRVFKWSPSFQTSKETSIVPVWFELPGLPCHLFDHGVLFSIMKAVGVPLSVDAATLNLSRPSVARANVEIDLMRELPSRIWIEHGDDGDGFWQKIIPEKLPLYCTSCFRQGHSHEACTMNENRMQKIWKVPAAKTPKPPSTAADAAPNSLLLEYFPANRDIAVGPNVPSETTPKVGDMVDLKRDLAEKSGMPNIQTKWLDNNSHNAGGFFVLSDPMIGESVMVEARRDRPVCSGKQMGYIEVEGNLSLADKTRAVNKQFVMADPIIEEGNIVEDGRDREDLSGKKMVYTQLQGDLSLAEKTLEANKEIQVSDQKIIDWDYVFQTISGNILNCMGGVHENLSSHTQISHHVNEGGAEDVQHQPPARHGQMQDTPTESKDEEMVGDTLKVVSNEEEPEIDQRTEFLNNLEKRQCALSYTLPRTESAPLLRIHWLDKESPEPGIPDIDAQGKSLYLDEGQGDNTMVEVQFQEQVTSQIIQAKTPVKTSRYNLRSLSKAEISEIQNSKKKKKKEARRNALEFNYSDSDTHIDVDETEMNMGFYGGGFDF